MEGPKLKLFDLDALVANFNEKLHDSVMHCQLGDFARKWTFFTNFWTPVTGKEVDARGVYPLVQPYDIIIGKIFVEQGTKTVYDNSSIETRGMDISYEILTLSTCLPLRLQEQVYLPSCTVRIVRGRDSSLGYTDLERTDYVGNHIYPKLQKALPIEMFPTPGGKVPELEYQKT